MLFPGDACEPGRHAGAYNPSTSVLRKLLRLFLVLLLLFALSWPLMETFMLETERTAFVSVDLPPSIGQLRIVYVTDIHKGGLYTDARLTSLISHVNACNADLVLLGGDYATDSHTAEAFFRQMPAIHARYGIYAVLGNHDRTQPDANLTTLRGVMLDAGVTMLNNTVSRVRIGGSSIYIAGIDDVVNGFPDLQGVASQVRASDYVIFLSHNPAIIPEALKAVDRDGRRDWFDLGLFGHTHGGQIAGLGTLLVQDEAARAYLQGWYRHNRIELLVSRGVGTSGLPLRLFCKPQIHLITVNAVR